MYVLSATPCLGQAFRPRQPIEHLSGRKAGEG